MPQLDIYVICDMLYSVLILFIFIYILNINNILIILSIIIRARILKISLYKQIIYYRIKEFSFRLHIKFYRYILKLATKNIESEIFKDFYETNKKMVDILDISIEK